jgi:hypothetical protein
MAFYTVLRSLEFPVGFPEKLLNEARMERKVMMLNQLLDQGSIAAICPVRALDL